jgi:alpha-galactosidase
MPIDWDADAREFHLRNGRLSYVIRVFEDGSLGHLHIGAPLSPGHPYRHLAPGRFDGFANRLGDPVPLEYPTEGIGDFRVPALAAVLADGSTALRLTYADHRIAAGKPPLPGLPNTYVDDPAEADTVEVDLIDAPSGVGVTLRYSIFRDQPALARSVTIRNGGDRPVRLATAMSLSLDLPDPGWDMTTLSGTGVRERHLVTRRLAHGRRSVSSRRGHSSHEHNPFLLLTRPATTEATGEALGVSLVYSGNFLAEAEVDAFGSTRIRIGIDPETFSWTLEPGDSFTTPEAVVAWSADGVGGLSDGFHRLYRDRLARGIWRDRPRPIVINNWEATYFGFDEARLLELADAAAGADIELFVLDDGWFGARDDDTSSLGDWVVDRRKLPNGLDGLARAIVAKGMQFGIWVEPEMVSRRSRLFEAHPDWAIGVQGRERTESRHQYVLDLTRREVVDHLFEAMSSVLSSAPIAYVKWDMNRSITEPWTPSLPPGRQGEFFHRSVLGLYELWDRLTSAFPDVLFESCAGGGGRFDPGLLAYAPQAWTSDDTDAVERLPIQWGSSIVYPLSSMAAHVSAVPNHQVGRVTPLATRAAAAFFGAFGYELDLTALEADELDQIADQVRFYREHRELFQFGRFVRLVSPFEADRNETAWMVVSNDRLQAIVGWYRVLNRPVPGPRRVRFRGLDPTARYRITLWPEPDDDTVLDGVAVRGGDELMEAGLIPGPFLRESAGLGDFAARLFVLEAIPDGP